MKAQSSGYLLLVFSSQLVQDVYCLILCSAGVEGNICGGGSAEPLRPIAVYLRHTSVWSAGREREPQPARRVAASPSQASRLLHREGLAAGLLQFD